MVKVHGLIVAAVFGIHLCLEARHLVFGVVQLREAVTKFTACDVELKTLGHFWALIVGAGQGRNFGGVLHDERGLPQFFFHGFFEVQHLQTGQ